MQKRHFSSLPALFLDAFGSSDFEGWFMRRSGGWESYSPEKLKRTLFFATLALGKLGVGEGESLGIAAKTSPEWLLADLGCETCHAATIPLFPNISVEHFRFQCDDSQVEFLAIDKPSDLDLAIRAELPRFKRVICFDDSEPLPPNGLYWKDLVAEGEILSKEPGSRDWFNYRVRTIRADDLFSVIYTSGSTGRPKGAELSHRNMLSLVEALDPLFSTDPSKDLAMSLLPAAHVFERMVICFYAWKHLRVYFVDDPRHVGSLSREIRPTIATFVPRILEKASERIASMEYKLKGAQRLLVHRAVLFAKKAVPGQANFRRAIYDRLVFRRIRAIFGGRFRWLISGSCSLDKTTFRFLSNVGLPIYEGYGLTECSPVVSVNTERDSKAGSVGKPLGHLRVKIGEENEVLVKGESVFQGYRNMPEMNRMAWTEDGFFRTGDQGIVDREGFLFLIGRIKEIFKTSTGKYVSPVPIELELVRHPMIDAALVIANGRKFVSVLLFVGEDEAARVLGKSGKSFDPRKAVLESAVLAAVAHHIKTVNQKLNHWEQIRKWTLIGDPLTIESGLMTPTYKLRRGNVERRYSKEIEEMYREKPAENGSRRFF